MFEFTGETTSRTLTSRITNTAGATTAFKSGTGLMAKAKHPEPEPADDSSLAESIKFECGRIGVEFDVDAIAEAFADAEIDDAPSTDAIGNHIGGKTKLSPGAKGLNRETLRAYGKLFKLNDPASLQRPSHIRDRMLELSKPANTIARHTMAAKNAKLSDAKERLESLWGGPHQSLAFFLLDYLAAD